MNKEKKKKEKKKICNQRLGKKEEESKKESNRRSDEGLSIVYAVSSSHEFEAPMSEASFISCKEKGPILIAKKKVRLKGEFLIKTGVKREGILLPK